MFIFKWLFRCLCRRCCLSSLLCAKVVVETRKCGNFTLLLWSGRHGIILRYYFSSLNQSNETFSICDVVLAVDFVTMELWLWRRRHDRNKFAYLTMYLCTCLFSILFISQSFSSCQRREMIWFVATWTLIIFHFFPAYLQSADSKIIPGYLSLRQVWQANWLGIIEKRLQKRGSYIFRCCSRSRPRSLRNGPPAPLFCSLGHCRQNIVHTLLVWVCNIVSEKTTYSFFGEHLPCVGDEQ